jgi:hypothetical protein
MLPSLRRFATSSCASFANAASSGAAALCAASSTCAVSVLKFAPACVRASHGRIDHDE